MELIKKPLSWFRPYARNPREHSPEALKQFAAALKRFGFRVPMLARSNGDIVDGHFRLEAAKVAGLAEVPVLLADDMSEADVRAFRLSVDQDNLLHELEALRDGGEALSLEGAVGFELEDFDPQLEVAGWDFSVTTDRFVVTITGSKPLEAEVRKRLAGMGDDVRIEVSTLESP